MAKKEGLQWLTRAGKARNWVDVTRDERFFCAHLYQKVLNDSRGIGHFVNVINEVCQPAIPLITDENWELGYEVCFYRDLQFYAPERFTCNLSPKRTFDLCLLSDSSVVIIEAKVYQSFDTAQTEEFRQDKDHIKNILKLPVTVQLIPLASSRYHNRFTSSSLAKAFDGGLLTWKKLAGEYAHDRLLEVADEVYERRPKSSGKNNTKYLLGSELTELFRSGAVDPDLFFVGRNGGARGVKEDAENGNLPDRPYQTNGELAAPPNRNWPSLAEFTRLTALQ